MLMKSFGKISRELSKIEKLIESLIMLIMIGNVASIFYTSVHGKGKTLTQFLCSFVAYSTINISFPSMGPFGHFHSCFDL